MASITGIFPGQGSQQVGMGNSFFAHSDTAQEIFALADRSLGFTLSKLCFEGPAEELTLTRNAQPAILTVSYIAFILSGLDLSSAAGHSLGEYSALVAAGSLSFSDAVQLVHKRGCYMQEAVPTGEGKMVAVLGPTEEEITAVISQISEGLVEVANFNCPGQTVVAGTCGGVDAFSEAIKAKGGKIAPLQVSAPFHTSLMKPAAEKLARDLDQVNFGNPSFPVYTNVTAKPVSTGAEACQSLKQQVCASVRWTESMINLIEDVQPDWIVEFGPGGILSRLLKRINNSISRLEVADWPSLENVRQKLG